MNEGLIPRRYAKALYKYALEKSDDKRVYRLCGQLIDSFSKLPELRAAVANPFIGNTDIVSLLTAAAGDDAAKDAVWPDFLKLLVDNKRIAMVRDIAIAYRDIYRSANNIYRVKVTSARDLTPAEDERLQALILKHLKGAKMEFDKAVDPNLVGGFKVTINNELLDASVANELKQLRLHLVSN